MREIKFRAWGFASRVMFPLDDAFVLEEGELRAIPNTDIMQFTGKRDKNGKEIYEGDIVSASIYSDETPSILEVIYQSGCFIIKYKDSESDLCPIGWFVGSLEVIGNIYKNPELLEGGNDGKA